jgi:AraC family cel operon transcriptional repressor
MEEVITVQDYDIEPYRYVLHRIQANRRWSFPRHNHSRVFEFYYLFQGELVQGFDSGELVMREGDFVSIGEKEFHDVRGRNFDFFNLILTVEYWERLQDTLGLRPVFEAHSKGGRLSVKLLPKPWVAEELEQLFLYQKSRYGDILLARFFLNLAAELQGPPDMTGEGDRNMPLWMKSLILEVEGRCSEILKVGDLARLADRSPEHLSRSFRMFLGKTPSAWLNEQKLERAALLLEHSNTAVLDIALSLGFDNLGYFYRLFKQRYSCPPAEYRRNHSLISPRGDS